MKIAVLSDIHGNLPALEVVAGHVARWRADLVIVNGDVVNRGPLSAACWSFVQERVQRQGWQLLAGNHEKYVSEWSDTTIPRHGPRFEINRASFWSYAQLNGDVAAMRALPEAQVVTAPDGQEVHLTHADAAGNLHGLYPALSDDEMRVRIRQDVAIFCTAHTHHAFFRRLGETLVVNSGSVGSPFDGDPRASYAQLVWRGGQWQATLVRLPYDRERAAADFKSSGFAEGGGPLVEIFFKEWLEARPMISRWIRDYQDAVLAGELSLAAAVSDFLVQDGDG